MPSAAQLLVDHIRNLAGAALHSMATDGQLLARWTAERDGRAFAALVGRHGPLVWRVARNHLTQSEDADDVFQATFLVLARKATALKRQTSIAG